MYMYANSQPAEINGWVMRCNKGRLIYGRNEARPGTWVGLFEARNESVEKCNFSLLCCESSDY